MDEPDDINATPVADDLDATVNIGGSLALTLAATDADAADDLTFIIITLPSSGSLSADGEAVATVPHSIDSGSNAVNYSPTPGFSGEDSFTYAASDGEAQSDPATVSITVTIPEPTETIEEDTTVPSLTVETGAAVGVANNAVVTVTGDTGIDGTLIAETGRIRLNVEGDLTINGTIRAVDSDALAADDLPLAEQPTAIILVVGEGSVSFGPNAVLDTNGPIIITDDETLLTRTPSEFFDEVEEVGGDDLPTLVPLPPDDPAFDEGGSSPVFSVPVRKRQVAPPITIMGTWPPAGAAPPPGDQPVIIFRFNGERDLNLDGWTVNGPAAPAADANDQSMNPGTNATGGGGKNGMRLNIWNNGGPINIMNNVVLNLTDGGDGGAATSECASATGGPGGNSGNFRMTAAGGINISNGTLTINPGRGGRGGDAFVNEGAPGAPGCPGETGRSATATGGKGGDNLKRIFARGNVAGLANMTIGPVTGGDGGMADASACDGGPGIICCNGGVGGAATATGGAGGGASLAVGTLGVATSLVSGGAGGAALAFAGDGGDGGDCKLDDAGDGGAGGAATSTGGAGGSAASDSAAGAMGGNGGDATSLGGIGGDGGDSGLGTPGSGGAGGAAAAIGGAAGPATTAGFEGVPTDEEGDPGEDGGALALVLYCFDLGLFGEGAAFIEPGIYDGPVFDADGTTPIGGMSVNFVDGPSTNYQHSDNPVLHVGIGNGALDINVASLQLEVPPPGVISGLQLDPLYGFNVSEQNPMQIQALNADGELIGSQTYTSVPNNEFNPTDPTPLNAEFAVDESVATFRIVVPEGVFVTIIRIYLVDP